MVAADSACSSDELVSSLLERHSSVFAQELNDHVDKLFRSSGAPNKLAEAMRYSLLAGGKRLRPALCVEICRALGGDPRSAYASACAVELIHTYSLIHDDLPCMDDDDMRRGRPSNHKVFGEALALLAGDGLLTLAFEVLAADNSRPPERTVASVKALARAAGPSGMVLGQVLDMAATGGSGVAELQPREELVDEIHRTKTGCLIAAACELGAIAAGASPTTCQRVREFGETLGLAFQIVDDILDVTGGDRLGKPKGSDAKQKKLTMVSILGLERAKKKAEDLISKTRAGSRTLFPKSSEVQALVDFVLQRTF